MARGGDIQAPEGGTLSARVRQFLRHPSVAHYPWDAVLLATMLVILIIILGSFAQDAIWTAHWDRLGRPVAGQFRGTCYWMADARILVRIASNGYSDYDVNLINRHLTILPDRSWWPVFVNLTAGMLRLTGGSYCSGWAINLIAMACLPIVIQAITRTRRPLLMAGVALLPFGTWLYAGIAEGVFLLFSAILLWLALHPASQRRRYNAVWSLASLVMGILVGLTKPNSIALLPGFLVLALARSLQHVRQIVPDEGRPPFRIALIAMLSDANPAWAATLGLIGILIGLGLWLVQTSGFYPFYVMMAQRTLWYKEFDGGNPLALLSYLTTGWRTFLSGGGLPHPTPWNMMEFAAITLMLILVVRDLRPRWPRPIPLRPTPLYATVSMLTVFWLMFTTGQSHSIQRYYVGNIFFVLTFLIYVHGTEDEPPLTALPGIIRRGDPGALRAALRLIMLVCGLALLIQEAVIMVIHGI